MEGRERLGEKMEGREGRERLGEKTGGREGRERVEREGAEEINLICS